MGLAGAPARQQRMMIDLFGDMPNVCVYLDDLIIGTGGAEGEELLRNHKRDVREVFLRLKKYNLKVKLEKCKYFRRKVTFLGHEVSEGERRPT